jgi:hypothetical protein
MRRAFGSCILILLGAVAANAADAKRPAFAYSSSGSCIASVLGFTSKLEPINAGVSWRITFNAVGSAGETGAVTEAGQSVDSASFGAGPRMHSPAANAYKDTFTSAVIGPNADGSSTLRIGMMSGTFTAGPHAGERFMISDFELTGWVSTNGLGIFGSSETPIIQTVSLSNGNKYQRVCTMLTVLTSALP